MVIGGYAVYRHYMMPTRILIVNALKAQQADFTLNNDSRHIDVTCIDADEMQQIDDYDAIIFVANWPDVRRFAWDTLLRARAIEDTCYVLAANRVGSDPACNYDGGTAFIGPYGETLAAVPDGQEGCICGEIDLQHLAEYHAKFPVLEDADDFTMHID